MFKLTHGILIFLVVALVLGLIAPALISADTVSVFFGITLIALLIVGITYWVKKVFIPQEKKEKK